MEKHSKWGEVYWQVENLGSNSNFTTVLLIRREVYYNKVGQYFSFKRFKELHIYFFFNLKRNLGSTEEMKKNTRIT